MKGFLFGLRVQFETKPVCIRRVHGNVDGEKVSLHIRLPLGNFYTHLDGVTGVRFGHVAATLFRENRHPQTDGADESAENEPDYAAGLDVAEASHFVEANDAENEEKIK